jgi:small-conductance mechanosensitive channel
LAVLHASSRGFRVTGGDPSSRRLAIRTLTPFEPAPGTVNHLLTARLRPDFKRAVGFGLLALVAAFLVRAYGNLSWSSLPDSVIAGGGSIAFVALAVLSVRSAASEVAAVSRARFGDAHASVVALLLTLAGYTATTVSLLVLLNVPVQRLLVSGAVTGVVLGIAAQQSLANVVAGLVLLLNRPFQVGQEITVRSGALAGPYSGRVLSVGLTYVQLDTEEGVVLIPNSGVLASVVGPRLAAQNL